MAFPAPKLPPLLLHTHSLISIFISLSAKTMPDQFPYNRVATSLWHPPPDLETAVQRKYTFLQTVTGLHST